LFREINPRNNRSYGTTEEIARCRPNGTKVAQRDYNPLERPWFRDAALSSSVSWHGPYFSNDDSKLTLLTVASGIFDRRYDFSLSSDRLCRSTNFSRYSELAEQEI
jgi:hypothetical protein